MSITLMGMVLGLTVDILIAAQFGTSKTADILIVAITFPLFIDTITREGTRLSLVPVFMQHKSAVTDKSYQLYISGLFNLSLLIGMCLFTVTFALSTLIVQLIGPGLLPESIRVGSNFLKYASPTLIFIPPISVLSIALNSNKKYALVALRNTVTPAVVILFMALFWRNENVLTYIAVAYSLGFMLYFILMLFGNFKIGFNYHFVLPHKTHLNELKSAISWPTLGFVIRRFSRVVETMIASLLLVGGVASYHYAFRIFTSIQTIIGSSIATTSLPEMALLDKTAIRNLLIRKNKEIILITAPIAFFIMIFNETIIKILYSRGGFSEESITLTSDMLFWLSFGIIFTCQIPLLSAVLYSLKKFKQAFLNMVAMAIINLILAYLLSLLFGLIGISIAISLTALISVLSLGLMLKKQGVNLLTIKK